MEPLDETLNHFGVKGMHWGVRKSSEGGIHPLQTGGPLIDPSLPKSTTAASKKVASLIGERYGFQISAVKAMETSDVDYDPRTIGFVQGTPGVSSGVIHVTQADVRKTLRDAETTGWFGKDCGTVPAFLTHEASHAIFHAEQKAKPGLLKSKVVGGNMKARDKALDAALKEAGRSGIKNNQELFTKVSGYAAAAGVREELEAEMFSQYHWGSNPPSFVQAWGKTLHKEMGLDDVPFREAVKHG